MKKLTITLVSFALALTAFTACGSSTSSASSTAAVSSTAVSAASTTAAKSDTAVSEQAESFMADGGNPIGAASETVSVEK